LAMASLPLAKLGGLLARQLAKPVSNRLQTYAKDQPFLRAQCIAVGQWLHLASVKILLRSAGQDLEYSTAIDGVPYVGIPELEDHATFAEAVSTAEGEAMSMPLHVGRLKLGRLVSLCDDSVVARGLVEQPGSGTPEWDSLGKGDKQLVYWRARKGLRQYAWIPIRIAGVKTLRAKVKPLPDDEALDRGAIFAGEVFVFGVAGTILMLELGRKAKDDRIAKETKQRRQDDLEAQFTLASERHDQAILDLRTRITDQDKALQSLQERWVQHESGSKIIFPATAAAVGAAVGVVVVASAAMVTGGAPRF